MPEVHIFDSYNLGDITSDIRGTLGGLIGYSFNYFTITNSYNAGNLNAPSERHGELVGGCDIITEMHNKGELLPLLTEANAEA